MDTDTLKQELLALAKMDVHAAKKAGGIIIVDTKSGNVDLQSTKDGFDFIKVDTAETIRRGLTEDEAIGFLSTLYVVYDSTNP